MKSVFTRAVLAAAFALAVAPAAFAQLNRVGPVGPLGYPTWYQDKTGLTLEFCDNQTQPELEGGWCVLLPPDLPTGAAPETRAGSPVNFADEHFYYLMNAGAAGVAVPGLPGQTVKVALVAAIEGAFGGGPVKAGDEMVFARLRIRMDPLPYSGTYTVYTPYGKRVFAEQLAGERLFVTEDVGLTVGNFQEALNGSIYPFIVPSASPGGPEMPPVSATNPTPDTDPAHFGGGAPSAYPANGRRYIADPARLGPVTGSLANFTADGISNPNLFRIDVSGPDVPGGTVTLYTTTDFSLAGRIYEGPISGAVTLDRASYSRSATSQKVDVYATATPITSTRIPATAQPAPIPSSLVYYNGACTSALDANGNPIAPYGRPGGVAAVPLLNSGTKFFGQFGTLPTSMSGCLEANATTATGQATTVYMPVTLADQVTITRADFDPSAQTLTITAVSSDTTTVNSVATQTLTVQGFGNLVSGQLAATQVLAAPATVTVTSSGGGSAARQVETTNTVAPGGGTTTGGGGGGGTTPPAPTTPIASNLSASTQEEVPVTLTLTPATQPATVTLVSTGLLGTAVVNTDGTVTYTPNPNASGNDTFAYTLTANGLTSNTATVSVTIIPVNDAPAAVAETVNGLVNVSVSVNLMANDTDPDGQADLKAIVIDSADPRLGTVSASGGVVTFKATSAGTSIPLTYHVIDQAGLSSPSITDRVTVAASESIAPVRWQYTVSQNRWVVTGTVNPNVGQSMLVSYAGGTYNLWNAATSRFVCTSAVGQTVGTATTDGTGTWTYDQVGINPNSIFNPTNSNNNVVSPDGRTKTSLWCTTPTLRVTSSVTGATVNLGAVQVK